MMERVDSTTRREVEVGDVAGAVEGDGDGGGADGREDMWSVRWSQRKSGSVFKTTKRLIGIETEAKDQDYDFSKGDGRAIDGGGTL